MRAVNGCHGVSLMFCCTGNEPPRTVVCSVYGVPHSDYSSRLQEEKEKEKCSGGSMCPGYLILFF